jgi:phage shock protein PspC (stress-responsive transcriptional regulator)
MSMNERLYRSRDDRIIAGVCGGLADRFDADPSLVRLACAAVWILTGVVPVSILYVLAVIIVPEAPAGWSAGAGQPAPPPPPADPAAFSAEPADGTAAGSPETTMAGAPADDWYAAQRTDRETRRAARREARAGRGADPLPAVIAGVALLGIGAWLLLRDVVSIRWDVVWPVAIIALGVILLVLALVPRSRGGSGGA